jgi:cytidylate kinase
VIIAIDGPAGSGKSSTAREVARRLGFRHLDSGAFYRTITLAAIRAAIPIQDWSDLDAARLDAFGIAVRPAGTGFELFLDDAPVSDAIRAPDVNAQVSRMARIPAVRAWVFDRFRDAARLGPLVTEGRDMGTVVFPEADLKVFLTAGLETRARRRLAERGSLDPAPETLNAEMERLAERDRRDSARAVAPLRKAEDAIAIDTSDLTFDQQVSAIVGLARQKASEVDGSGPA